MSFWDWYDRAQQEAQAFEVPLHELDWLIEQHCGLSTLALRLRSQPQESADWRSLDRLWQKRITDRVPVQYLVGRLPWRDLSLEVTPAVLIPRPETELVIDLIQSRVYPQGSWCDLGTGSGAIALSLALAFPALQVFAVDISAAALAVTDRNIRNYALESRVKSLQGEWFSPLPPCLDGMVANPPYIPRSLIPALQPEVRLHEPCIALDGGEDGLDAIRQLITQGPHHLRSGGFWLCEVMDGQAKLVSHLLADAGTYQDILIHPDLAGVDRFVSAFVVYP